MATRTSITLHPTDEAAIADFRTGGTPEHQAMAEWARDNGLGEVESPSEAAIIRLLMRAGAAALRERALDIGYASLAVSYSTADVDETRAARRRYEDRTEASAGR